jgi:hypothetical protein
MFPEDKYPNELFSRDTIYEVRIRVYELDSGKMLGEFTVLK